MKYLFIDIRKSDEVYSNHLVATKQYEAYNIPMNMIRFNEDMIRSHLNYVDFIYIICRSSARSQFIKNKYFSKDKKIKVSKELQFNNLKKGCNNININNQRINVVVNGSNSFNLYSMMRILQLFLGSIILTLGGYTLYSMRNKKINNIPLMILVAFGIMAIYNGLTSTCTISKLLINHLN